jgi:hypothetical protein
MALNEETPEKKTGIEIKAKISGWTCYSLLLQIAINDGYIKLY